MSLNLPNALAFLRVFLAPLMFWLLLSANSFSSVHVSWMNYFAALVFVIASVTDFFDGFIARARGRCISSSFASFLLRDFAS